MHYLLELRRDERLWLLPIADRTAASLEQALLECSEAECRKHLIAACTWDRYLATWLADIIASRDVPNIDTLADAASWLADGTSEKLANAILRNAILVPSASAIQYAQIAAQLAPTICGSVASIAENPAFWHRIRDQASALLEHCPLDSLGRKRLLPSFALVASRCRHESDVPQTTPIGDAHQRTLAYYLDEVPGVAQRLPSLVARLAGLDRAVESIKQQLEQQKLASLKELAYGASHEINNPLANIAARAQTLLRDEPDPQRRKKLAAIFEQAMRAHEMIADLMLFAHPPRPIPDKCSLTEITRKTIDSLAEDVRQRQVDLRLVDDGDDVELFADPTQLAVAVGAIVKNALEAVGHGGHIWAAVNVEDDFARLVVSDDGPGMTERVREHLFDPFFSGREAGRGLGFGLSKCWRIVTDHGGDVHVRSIVPHGTEFTITLPRLQAA